MASPHRKLFPKQLEQNSTTSIIISPPPSMDPTVETCIHLFCDPLQNDAVPRFCPTVCLALCPSICKYSMTDYLSPPPQPNKSHNLSPLLISMLIILAILFIIIIFYVVYTKIYPYFNNNIPQTRPGQTRSWQRSDDNNNTIDETVLFHPIWYIPTVGLNPSVINSITVHTYQRSSKGGVHVDGSDCAVCLAEFQDGDKLRVLPKCNHAFHLPCIDTWLRSHTNCPLCRAPVVVSDSDNNRTADIRASPSLGVDVTTQDHDDRDRDDDQRIALRRSSSFDGNCIGNNKKEMMRMNSGGNKESGSSSSRHERGPVCLVGRSFSCTAKIFSSRYNNNNNNNNNNNVNDDDDNHNYE